MKFQVKIHTSKSRIVPFLKGVRGMTMINIDLRQHIKSNFRGDCKSNIHYSGRKKNLPKVEFRLINLRVNPGDNDQFLQPAATDMVRAKMDSTFEVESI